MAEVKSHVCDWFHSTSSIFIAKRDPFGLVVRACNYRWPVPALNDTGRARSGIVPHDDG
jgi:hypothetical protein